MLLPAGAIYREQNIILSPFDEDGSRHFYARRMFMGCRGLGPLGLMEGDPLLVQAEQKLIGQADELVVLHVSRLVREKRVDTVTRALNLLKAPHRVVIVGDGPDRAYAQEELPHAIFAGFLVGEDLATAYASSDIFIFPSDSESFGNVTLEAMASGLACVCADATGSRSLVVAGAGGSSRMAWQFVPPKPKALMPARRGCAAACVQARGCWPST